LQETDQHNADTFGEIQVDTVNAFAIRLLPYLMDVQWSADPQAEDFDEEAYQEWLDFQAWLGEWDFRNEADSPYPVLFSIFWVQVVDRVFDDELSMETGGGEAQRRMIFDLLEQPNHPWWDDVRTLEVVEDRDLTLRNAFAATIDAAQDQFGGVRDRWQWGELHTVTFRSIPLGDNPVAEITELLNRGTVAVGGDSDSLNNTRWSTTRADRYQVTALSAFRMILDLSDFESSRSILSTGQSGHPASDHYDDMIELWRGVGYRDMIWDFDGIHRASEDRLILEPAPVALGQGTSNGDNSTIPSGSSFTGRRFPPASYNPIWMA
jgi:penicillin amidase